MTGPLDVIATAQASNERIVRLVDCDVHAQPTPEMLLPHLGERARRRLVRYGRRMPNEMFTYPRARGGGVRTDAWPDIPGGFPGSDPELLRAQLLDEWDIDYAVLEVMAALDCYDPPDVAADLARAVNDWVVADWLDFDSRLRAAIVIPHDYAALAVAEIERRASDPRFVAVFMPTHVQEQLGSPRYWPIYEAATAHGLPVAFHTGGWTRQIGAGPPTYYLSYHVNISCGMQSQIVSMVASGMFDAIPDVRLILIECGVSWAASLRWTMDATWELMRDDLPQIQRKPSEYFHEHLWFTTQPIEEPVDPTHLLHAIDQGELADRLVFATDYPHWDFDSPTQALPRAMPSEMRAAILHGNALELFGLPATRSVIASSQPRS